MTILSTRATQPRRRQRMRTISIRSSDFLLYPRPSTSIRGGTVAETARDQAFCRFVPRKPPQRHGNPSFIGSERTAQSIGDQTGSKFFRTSVPSMTAGSAVVLDGAPGMALRTGVDNRFAFRTVHSGRLPCASGCHFPGIHGNLLVFRHRGRPGIAPVYRPHPRLITMGGFRSVATYSSSSASSAPAIICC